MPPVKGKSAKGKVISKEKDGSEIQNPDAEQKEPDLMNEDINIEADAEIDAEVDFGDIVEYDDDELQAEFSEENDAATENQEHSSPVQEKDESGEEGKTKRFVIPKIKKNETEAQNEQDSSDASQKSNQVINQEISSEEKDCNDEIQEKSNDDNSTAEVADDALMKEDQNEEDGEEKSMDIGEDQSNHKEQALTPLKIPEGKDSIAVLREHYPWQVRVYPFTSTDATRSEFAQIWAMAKSSSIVWTTHLKSSGVGEFLLEDRSSVQKFMRKLMWHVFVNRQMIMEITEREASEGSINTPPVYDHIINTAVFKYNNHKARQLLKTYYPSPRGEVTERSVYVNNVGTGVSADIMKGIFPCALKIGVAKASKDTSSALVETESEEAAFNYLVVYQQIQINGLDLQLSTIKHDWEGAKKMQHKSETGSVSKSSKSPLIPKPPRSDHGSSSSKSTKRPSSSSYSSPAKRERSSNSGSGSRERGANRRGPGAVRGRGGIAPLGRGGRGRGLLPNPSGEGLLPTPPPLMSLPGLSPPPMPPGALLDAKFLMAHEHERQAVDLHEARSRLESQVMETRANLVLAARRAEVQAVSQLQNRLSLLDRMHPAANRPVALDLMAEELRESRRAPRLLDDFEQEDWSRESATFRAPLLPEAERDFDRRAFSRERREEEFGDRRSSLRPKPYLLEVPEDKEQYGEPFDYGHSTGRTRSARYEGEVTRAPDEGRVLLNRRGGLLERDRPAYSDDRPRRGHESYEYEGRDRARPAVSGRGYEEEDRRSRGAPREPAANYAFDRRY